MTGPALTGEPWEQNGRRPVGGEGIAERSMAGLCARVNPPLEPTTGRQPLFKYRQTEQHPRDS